MLGEGFSHSIGFKQDKRSPLGVTTLLPKLYRYGDLDDCEISICACRGINGMGMYAYIVFSSRKVYYIDFTLA